MTDDEHDIRGLISEIRDEPIPEHWDPASGGAYIRILWAPDIATATRINALLDPADATEETP